MQHRLFQTPKDGRNTEGKCILIPNFFPLFLATRAGIGGRCCDRIGASALYFLGGVLEGVSLPLLACFCLGIYRAESHKDEDEGPLKKREHYPEMEMDVCFLALVYVSTSMVDT